MIRPVRETDAPAVSGIYQHYIEDTAITFEETPVESAEMAARIRAISAAYPYLVWEGPEGVEGYAYANKWKERASYRFSVELSIYLRKGSEGKGIGTALMEKLLGELQKTSIHAVVSWITLPNDRSVALHEKFGFEKIAHFKEIGWKFGQWQDVGCWALVLGGPPRG